MAQQSDAAYMASLARQRHAIMETHAWDERLYAETGEWRLVPRPVLDGTVKPAA